MGLHDRGCRDQLPVEADVRAAQGSEVVAFALTWLIPAWSPSPWPLGRARSLASVVKPPPQRAALPRRRTRSFSVPVRPDFSRKARLPSRADSPHRTFAVVKRSSCWSGRTDQLQALDDVLDRATEAGPAVLVIEGDVGTGKTALLDELTDRASDFHILAAEGNETDRKAYDALMQWGVGRDRTRAAPRRAAQQLNARIDELPATRPILLRLDNLQWADPESVEALTWLLTRSAGDRILVAVGQPATCRRMYTRTGSAGRLSAGAQPNSLLSGLDLATATTVRRSSASRPRRSLHQAAVGAHRGQPALPVGTAGRVRGSRADADAQAARTCRVRCRAWVNDSLGCPMTAWRFCGHRQSSAAAGSHLVDVAALGNVERSRSRRRGRSRRAPDRDPRPRHGGRGPDPPDPRTSDDLPADAAAYPPRTARDRRRHRRPDRRAVRAPHRRGRPL